MSIPSLGQRPGNGIQITTSAESASQARGPERYCGARLRLSKLLRRAFSARSMSILIPGAMPQAALEAPPSALNTQLDPGWRMKCRVPGGITDPGYNFDPAYPWMSGFGNFSLTVVP